MFNDNKVVAGKIWVSQNDRNLWPLFELFRVWIHHHGCGQLVQWPLLNWLTLCVHPQAMGDVFKALLIKLNPDTPVAGHSKMECVGVLAVLCVKKREREPGNFMNLGSGVKLWKWHLNNNGRVVYSNLIISIWPQKRRSGSPQNSITYGRRNHLLSLSECSPAESTSGEVQSGRQILSEIFK